jgi:hypothetical protein
MFQSRATACVLLSTLEGWVCPQGLLRTCCAGGAAQPNAQEALNNHSTCPQQTTFGESSGTEWVQNNGLE